MTNLSESESEHAEPGFNIRKVYLKDLSLEQPNSPAIFLETEIPAIEVEFNVLGTPLADNLFETALTLTMTARIQDKVAFLIEAKQAGIFEILNIAQAHTEQLLSTVCPSIIFPYLRANIADILTRAGFPPIHLAEINFQALYEQRAAQHQETERE